MASQAVTSDPRTPGHSITEWAVDLIGNLNQYGFHIPVTPTTVGILVTWANHESSGYNPSAPGGAFNPLNTTETSQGGVANFSTGHPAIPSFKSYEDGIRNQAYNLARAGGSGDGFGYRRILSALSAQDAAGTFNAIANSAFGTHNLIGASPTPVVQLPSGHFIPLISGPVRDGGQQPSQQAQLTSLFDPGGPLFGSPLANFFGQLGVHSFDFLNEPGKAAGVWLQIATTLLNNWPYILEFFVGMIMVAAGAFIILADTKVVRNASSDAAVAAAAA